MGRKEARVVLTDEPGRWGHQQPGKQSARCILLHQFFEPKPAPLDGLCMQVHCLGVSVNFFKYYRPFRGNIVDRVITVCVEIPFNPIVSTQAVIAMDRAAAVSLEHIVFH